MTRRNLIIGILVVLAAIIFGKNIRNRVLPGGEMIKGDLSSSNLPVTPEPITGKPQVEVSTSKGRFTVELRPDLAPKTVTNYLGKWVNGSCDGRTFHRVEDWVVQGCDPKGDGTGGTDSLPTETSSEPFTAGSLGVARKPFPKEVSNDSQFFIVKKDSLFLNNDYTYFGRVISGMDVIQSLTPGDKIISTTILSK